MKRRDKRASDEPESRDDAEKLEPTDGHGNAGDAENNDAENDKDAKNDKHAERDRPRSRKSAECRRHAGTTIVTVLLLVASLVAVFLPMWGIPFGVDLGGGNVVTLTASDYEDGTTAADVLRTLRRRADALQQHDVQISQTGDDTFELRVPAGYDASTVADALTQGGALQLVRVDSIADADVLQKLQNNASNVTLAEGSYDAFVTPDEVTGAGVTEQSYYGMTYYAVTVSLNSDGSSSLADVTGDLSADGASGQIAVVMDGAVIASPSVSSKIEGGKLNISGGFTEDQAYAYASALAGGQLRCSLSQTEPAAVGARAGGNAFELAWAAFVIVALACGAVCIRRLGPAGRIVMDVPLVTVILALGVLTVAARFDAVVLGRMELLALLVVEICAIIASARIAARYRSERLGGASVRKSQQQACGPEAHRLMGIAGAVLVVAAVVALAIPGSKRELAIALACGMGALLVALVACAPSQLAIYTANDVEKTEDEQLEVAPASKSKDGE